MWIAPLFLKSSRPELAVTPKLNPVSEPKMRTQVQREDDGRWICEVPALPGVMAYGITEEEARASAVALGRRVVAEGLANGESVPALA